MEQLEYEAYFSSHGGHADVTSLTRLVRSAPPLADVHVHFKWSQEDEQIRKLTIVVAPGRLLY